MAQNTATFSCRQVVHAGQTYLSFSFVQAPPGPFVTAQVCLNCEVAPVLWEKWRNSTQTGEMNGWYSAFFGFCLAVFVLCELPG